MERVKYILSAVEREGIGSWVEGRRCRQDLTQAMGLYEIRVDLNQGNVMRKYAWTAM